MGYTAPRFEPVEMRLSYVKPAFDRYQRLPVKHVVDWDICPVNDNHPHLCDREDICKEGCLFSIFKFIFGIVL